MEIGKKLKGLRIQNGLTQAELADRSELSKGFISMLENDLTSPSVVNLIDILEVFGMSISEFFAQEQLEEIVYKKANCFEIDKEEYHLTWLINDAQSKVLEPLMYDLLPNGKSELYLPNESEFYGYVLKGSISLFIGDTEHFVKKGDSFYFSKPSKNFYLHNKSKNRHAQVLWVCTPPNF